MQILYALALQHISHFLFTQEECFTAPIDFDFHAITKAAVFIIDGSNQQGQPGAAQQTPGHDRKNFFQWTFYIHFSFSNSDNGLTNSSISPAPAVINNIFSSG